MSKKTFGQLLGSKTRGFINKVKGNQEAILNAGVMGVGVGYFPVSYRPLPMGSNRFYENDMRETGGGGAKGAAGMIRFHGTAINQSIEQMGGISAKQYTVPTSKLSGPMARAWFLSPEITERAFILRNLRKLYRLTDIEISAGELSLAWIQLHQSTGDDMMSPLQRLTDPDEEIATFDIHQAYALTGDEVWRKLIERFEEIEPSFMNPDSRPNLHNLLGSAILGDTGSIFLAQFSTEGQAGTPLTPLKNLMPQDHETLVSMDRQYDRLAASATGTLLSYMNKELRARFTTDDPDYVPLQSREVRISREADMPEEHALQQQEGVQQVGNRGSHTIGYNQSMDYAYSMGGRVHIGDLTNMEITSGFKHGQTRGKIMTAKAVKEAIENNDTDKIKDEIYKYYKTKALPDYNKAIRAIRERASVTFKAADEALSPEQMRSPYGRRNNLSVGKRKTPAMMAKGAQHWEGGQNIRGAFLRDISLTNKATEKYITKIAFGIGKVKAAKSATEYVNHILAEWHTHQGAFTQNLTVSKHPFLTASIEMEMWNSGADKFLFKLQAFKEDNVRIRTGHALLSQMEEAGIISAREKARIIFDMKAAHLLKRSNTSASEARINANNETMGRRLKSGVSHASMALFLPEDYEQEIYKNILDNIDAPNYMQGYGQLSSTTRERMHTGLKYGSRLFNNTLSQMQYNYRQEGRFWPHVMSMWGAPYLAQISQY